MAGKFLTFLLALFVPHVLAYGFPTRTALPTDTPLFPAVDPLYPPPVSPDPVIVPDFAQAWSIAYSKAKALISGFTIEQKVNITTGVGWGNGPCVGNIPPVADFSGLCLQDSPLGVRSTDLVSSFPAGLTAASTWNRALIRARGFAMGQEFKAKGVNLALGPMMNMGRVAQGGRNWEGFGADPFLAGEATYETVLGMQAGGVQATAKHFINNDQEWMRNQSSSNVDDRTQHEIYAHPFMRAVMAGVSAVMCSYNLINDTYACNNNKTLNDILKREFGFRGFVMSDWYATMTTLSAVQGLDMTMPGDIYPESGSSYFGRNLTTYVTDSTISLSRLDDMATRIVAAWYHLHQDQDYPQTTIDVWSANDPINRKVNAQSDHAKVVREVAAGGVVLLKNEGALPLMKPKSAVLIGSDAAPPRSGPNEYPYLAGDPTGVLSMGWGSGIATLQYLISPYEAIQARARVDQTILSWDFDNWDLDKAASAVIDQEVAIVFVNSDSGEGYTGSIGGNPGDRLNLTAWHEGDNLILSVAAQNNNTIVVINSVGPLILEPWVEHPNVTAVVWAGLGGSETGSAIADVLYGDWNPSGRLPFTIAKKESDYPAHISFVGGGTEILPVNYSEGLAIDYRWFDAKNITPRYEFGFGLSYTTFEYSNLAVTPIVSTTPETELVENWTRGGASPISEGSTTAFWLHMPAIRVTFDVTNTGSYFGVEVPQLYLHHPESAHEPPSVLKGFTNVNLDPGQTGRASITLSRYDLSIWDVLRQGWAKPNGTIEFSIGASSRDFRLSGAIPVSMHN